ncbi:hypothetical protein D7Z26_10335 [Cohnella endophytica]|uniref:Uncharacterized protein n=1 Tax=Cohnella endophytica TaxID=2419778 RepID=A0A494Y4T8_9BACL|nr:hypothetical protein [Cohnella endophytica]RKP55571.1 hypothetical protein D7Z26_10335 [Cohnella endophytica]
MKERTQTLGLDLTTTKFLGTHEIAELIIEKLKMLPKKFQPTKSEYYSSKNKGKFSIDSPSEFFDKVPGEYLYGGYAWLYKVKQIFSIYITWTKCPESLSSDPTLIFNTIWIHFDDGISLLNNQKEFQIIENIWMELCKDLDAWYGSCHLYSNEINSNSYLGWGFGRCIPRLHWKTYFGEVYKACVPIQNINFEDTCKVELFPNKGFQITINDLPTNLVTRNDLERKIIHKIGQTYFWNEHDNRLDPKFEYIIPKLDFSEVIYKDM